MKDLTATALRYRNNRLELLDQHLLPDSECWLECDSVTAMVTMIRRLQIRGAPLIGIGAALLLAHLAEQGQNSAQLRAAAARLREARPTAVNLMNCLDRMLAVMDQGPAALVACAESLFEEDVALCQRMSELGADLLPEDARVLTHCNTGSLATAGAGTAIGVITEAFRRGRLSQVWVDETRPLLQGGRLTAWEMNRLGIPHRILCDSMAAILMRSGQVDAVLVGADRIAANGDFANKVGTYSLAVNAHHHGAPFYVVAPWTTVDPQCPDGEAIPIEQRSADEVKGVSGSFGEIRWSPVASEVFNPAFDVTPADLVTGWVLDTGVYDRDSIAPAIAAVRASA